jgi:hypothetical protein
MDDFRFEETDVDLDLGRVDDGDRQ